MPARSMIFNFLNNIESYVCRTLLAVFVTLLFIQIISREVFQHSIAWGEELATYLFVWFAYFGASHAAKMAAHNRVTFQFKPFPKIVATISEFFADMIWLAFNVYFVYLSYDFVFNRMNLFWKSQNALLLFLRNLSICLLLLAACSSILSSSLLPPSFNRRDFTQFDMMYSFTIGCGQKKKTFLAG